MTDTPVALGTEAIWLIVVKCVLVFAALMGVTLLTIWAERRIVARMQARLGPNRVGPFGVGQGLADGIKLMLKEDIVPALADKPVYVLAPILSAIPAFLAFSVIPFGPEVTIAGERTALQLTDLSVGVLFVLAMSGLGVYGIVLAGWSSGSTYPLLGALRSAAQVISYEIAMGLSFVAVFLFTGSLSTRDIVEAQRSGGTFEVLGLVTVNTPSWFIVLLPISFGIYVVAMVGETNRAPFDLPEAESELVGGFHTEYSSIKFALFFLAEYINMVTVSALAVTLFLGGWLPVWPISLWDGADSGFWPLLWFTSKVLVFLFVFIWLRGTLPRVRYDQFMALGWKRLIPWSLAWIVAVAGIRSLDDAGVTRSQLLLGVAAVLFVGAGSVWIADSLAARRRAQEQAAEDRAAAREQTSASPFAVDLERRPALTGAIAGTPGDGSRGDPSGGATGKDEA